MERSFQVAARLNPRRRVLQQRITLLRSQFRHLPKQSSAPSARMATYTSDHSADTPPHDNTAPKPTMREAGRPLQPLNQNVEPSIQYHSAGMFKKKGQHDYGYRPTPIPYHDDSVVRPSEDPASPYDYMEAVQYGDSMQYFSRYPYYCEEGRVPSCGYLEDDIDGIPPPPAQHRVSTPQNYKYEYGPQPTPPSYMKTPWSNVSPPLSRPEEQYSPPYYDPAPVDFSPQSHDRPHMPPSQAALRFESPLDEPLWLTTPRSPGELQDLDIVCGRGAPTNYHYGNQIFKELIQDYQTAYLCARRSDKPQVAMKILHLVKNGGARFVKREKSAGVFAWVEIDTKGAYEKVCQALREGSSDLHKKVLSVDSKNRATKGKGTGNNNDPHKEDETRGD